MCMRVFYVCGLYACMHVLYACTVYAALVFCSVDVCSLPHVQYCTVGTVECFCNARFGRKCCVHPADCKSLARSHKEMS